MKRFIAPALASALVLFFVSCSAPTTPAAAASTVSSAFAKGVITAKGSIWVNGIEYDTVSTQATVDGSTGTTGDDSGLKVGMTVSLKGSVDSSTGKGKATTVNYESSLKGAIDSASILITTAGDDFTGSFKVYGQNVTTSATTVFEGKASPTVTSLATLAGSDFVEVSGQLDVNKNLVANRVEFKSVADPFKLKGTVSAPTTTATGGSFTLTNEQGMAFTVNYTGTLDAAIVNTSEVRVVFTTAPAGSTITTTAAQIKVRAAELQAGEGDKIEVDGIIVNYVSSPSVSFTIDGRNIVASDAVVTAAGGASSLANGIKVEVEGTMSAGKVTALKIIAKKQPDKEVVGTVTAKDPAAGTFTVHPATGADVVLYTLQTTLFHDTAWKGSNPLSTLVVNTDKVGVKYYLDADSKNKAVKVERQ